MMNILDKIVFDEIYYYSSARTKSISLDASNMREEVYYYQLYYRNISDNDKMVVKR
jgi:hypothetical protein